MTQREVNDRLAAIASEEMDLKYASVGVEAYGVGELDHVAKASAAMRRKRLAELALERLAIVAPEPPPPTSVTASIKLGSAQQDVMHASVQQTVSGQLLIWNEGPTDVTVAAVLPWSEPAAASISDLTPSITRPPVVLAGTSMNIAFSVLGRSPGRCSVGAHIRFDDGAEVDAEPATLIVHPPR